MEIQDLPRGDYELTWFEPGDFTDNHGNYWCNAAFKGVSEPVRWVVKDPQAVKVGEKYYGHFTLETSKANNTYIRFRREQRPDDQPALLQNPVKPSGPTPSAKKEWQPRDDDAIRAQWAIGQAVHKLPESSLNQLDKIEALAVDLYSMVDRVKGSSESTNPKTVEHDEFVDRQVKSGYDKFKASRPTLQEDKAEDEEIKARLAQAEKELVGEVIDLDDIPF